MPDFWDKDPQLHAEAERLSQKHQTSRRYTAGHDQEVDRAAVTLIKPGGLNMMEKVDWVWPGWLANGKLHILGGQKGTGKSTIAFDLFAQITVGGKFPDGTPAPLGDVLIWSGEDDIKDTILPRIVAAGGNPARIYFPDSSITVDGTKRNFDPGRDIETLLAAAREIPELRAFLVDPVVSASKADSHKNAETRRGLQPLVDMAVEMNIVLLGITHFTKGTQGQDPIERITGSLAYGALPRVVRARQRERPRTRRASSFGSPPISARVAAASNIYCTRSCCQASISPASASFGENR